MDSYNETFLKQYCESFFSEYSSKVNQSLRQNNNDYCEVMNKKLKILTEYKRVDAIFDDLRGNKGIWLSPNDIIALREYIQLIYTSQFFVEQEMFIRGMSEEYYLLKKMGLLK